MSGRTEQIWEDVSGDWPRRVQAAARSLRIRDFDHFCARQEARLRHQLQLRQPRHYDIREHGMLQSYGAVHYQGVKRHAQA